MVLPKDFSLPKCRVRAQTLLQSSLSISAGLWALFPLVTGLQLAVSPHSPQGGSAEGTKLEPSFLPHERRDTHNIWIWAKATPCHQLHSLQNWVLTELSFPGKAPVSQCLGAHPTTLEGNEKESDMSLSSPHIIAVKFYGLIRHFYLQWESKHRQEICQDVQKLHLPAAWKSRISHSLLRWNNPCPSGHCLFNTSTEQG